MKCSIDKKECIGCGMCAVSCPDFFQIADDGLAETVGTPTAELAHDIREAAANCPASAIMIEE